MNRPAKLQRSYQIELLRKLDTTKKLCVTRLYTMLDGGCFFAKKAAGVSWPTFSIDCTARVARLSAVLNRRPYPKSVAPASLLKIVVGSSTVAPASGTAYFCQRTGCADTDAVPAKRQTTRKILRIPEILRLPNRCDLFGESKPPAGMFFAAL